nr:ribonuclease H-like domain, reverse transcriptase, RNA-dependent DNA polymerase [Tanacetum cinerariifolium]
MFKFQMKDKFEMSDLGLLAYYLGIEVTQTGGEITIKQTGYINKILKETSMIDSNDTKIPMDPSTKLVKAEDGNSVDATYYRSLIGSLKYLLHTRPDLSYSVRLLSRFMQDPKDHHLKAVKQVIRYIKGTKEHGIIYKKEGGCKITGYSDSSYGINTDQGKGTTEIVFYFGESPITWCTQKQPTVALSSCESEFMAATGAANDETGEESAADEDEADVYGVYEFHSLPMEAEEHGTSPMPPDSGQPALDQLLSRFDFLFQEDPFYVKRSKCAFGAATLEYLSHFISGRGVEMNPKKITTVLEWQTFYRRRDSSGEKETKAFKDLKQNLFNASLLGLTDFDQAFLVEADTSGYGIGVVLLQNIRPISYFSRKLGNEEFIKHCLVCQQTKYSTQATGDYLQPLPTPTAVWENVSMDFITGYEFLRDSRLFLLWWIVLRNMRTPGHYHQVSTATSLKTHAIMLYDVCGDLGTLAENLVSLIVLQLGKTLLRPRGIIGISLPQQGEPFFTSSGEVFWQLELITGRLKDIVFVKSSADNTKMTITSVERPWLSEAEVAVTNSSTSDYDSAYESSVYSIPLPPLKRLDGAEPISRPKTIKSIL